MNCFFRGLLSYYFLKFIGLCPFTLTKKGCYEKSLYGTLHNSMLILSYVYVCSVVYVRKYHDYTPQDTQTAVIMDLVALIFESLSVINCLFIFGFRQKYIIQFFKRFNTIEQQFFRICLRKGKRKNLALILSRLKSRVAIVGMAYFIICVVDHSRFLSTTALDGCLFHWMYFRMIYVNLYISNYVFIKVIVVLRFYFHEINSFINNNFEFLVFEGKAFTHCFEK